MPLGFSVRTSPHTASRTTQKPLSQSLPFVHGLSASCVLVTQPQRLAPPSKSSAQSPPACSHVSFVIGGSTLHVMLDVSLEGVPTHSAVSSTRGKPIMPHRAARFGRDPRKGIKRRISLLNREMHPITVRAIGLSLPLLPWRLCRRYDYGSRQTDSALRARADADQRLTRAIYQCGSSLTAHVFACVRS